MPPGLEDLSAVICRLARARHAWPRDQITLRGEPGSRPGHGAGFGNVHLWSVAGRRTIATLHDPGGQGVFSFGFSPDGNLLAVTDALHVFVWDVRSGMLVATIRPPRGVVLRCLEFSPAGQSIAVTGDSPETYIWSTSTRKLVAVLTDPSGAGVSSLVYSPDGRTLAVSDADGHIYLWDVSGLP